MQIIGIDYDDKALRCGRIQNADKPEFVKLKQFPANNKGLKSLDAWIDECCAKDHSSVLISLVVDNQQGASLAYRFYNAGFAIAPMTLAGIRTEIRKDKLRRQASEIIAQKAASWNMRWTPLSSQLLELRSHLIEREISRIECLHNQAKNQVYEAQAFDFLIQLTQNAANAHAIQIENAEKAILALMEKVSAFKTDFNLLMTIPGMTQMAAAALVYVTHAFPADSAENMASMLKLHDAAGFRAENYRAPELKIARMELYCAAQQAQLVIPGLRSLSERMIASGKSLRCTQFAACHKLAKMAFSMIKNQKAYQE